MVGTLQCTQQMTASFRLMMENADTTTAATVEQDDNNIDRRGSTWLTAHFPRQSQSLVEFT